MKKTILGAVAALLCSAVFAEMDLAGGTLTFVNKLDIEPVLYTKNRTNSDLDGIHFSGIYNTTEITFKTDLIDLYIEPEMYIENRFGININNTHYAHAGKTYNCGMFRYSLIDYAITIKPFEKVWFGISDEMYTKGSYLPVSDSNVSYGAFIVNDLFFNKSHYKGGIYSNSDYKPYYKTNLGFYASFDANKWLGQNLTVNTSYTFVADKKYFLFDYAVGLLSASVEWKNEKFNFAAQGQFRLTKSEYAKDKGEEISNPYSLAFKAGYTVNEKWLAECYLNINKYEEHSSNGEMYYSINPCATYTYNEHHKFRAGLNYNFYTDRWNDAFVHCCKSF